MYSASEIPRTDKIIVFDLDATLIATQNHMETLFASKILSDPKLLELRNRTYIIDVEDLRKPGAGTSQKCWGVTRPYTKSFLAFCSEYFKLITIYSAGQKEYVEPIVDFLFKDLPYPALVYSHNEVHEYIENGQRVIEKPLIKMIKELGGEMTLENTLAIDDLYTTYNQNPGNGILIPPYSPDLGLEDEEDGIRKEDMETYVESLMSEEDNALLLLQNWLMQPEVIRSRDVRKLNKNYIFDDIEEY